MINLPELVLDPGSEYDFAISDDTTLLTFNSGDWSGDITDHVILNSEDGITAAVVHLPSDIEVSFCDISNISVVGDYKFYADVTCKNNGNNNSSVVFAVDVMAVGGTWRAISNQWVLISGVWKPIGARYVLSSGVWKI